VIRDAQCLLAWALMALSGEAMAQAPVIRSNSRVVQIDVTVKTPGATLLTGSKPSSSTSPITENRGSFGFSVTRLPALRLSLLLARPPRCRKPLQ